LINGDDESTLAAQITQRGQIVSFGKFLPASHEECPQVFLGTLLGVEDGAIGQRVLTAQRQLG
jgi:hypothetical protein